MVLPTLSKLLFIYHQFSFIVTDEACQFPGGNSEWEPPESIPNSEVKTLCADDSLGSPHVKVGHRQDFYSKTLTL